MSYNRSARQLLNTSFLHNNSVNLLKTDIMDLQAENRNSSGFRFDKKFAENLIR